MSAQNAIISASYFSLIHDSNTDVSNPPEYARTIFNISCANEMKRSGLERRNVADIARPKSERNPNSNSE